VSETTAAATLLCILVSAPQPILPATASAHQAARRGRSFTVLPARNHRAAARKHAALASSLRRELRRQASLADSSINEPLLQEFHPALDKRPFTGPSVPPSSLAQATPLGTESPPILFIHAPRSSVIPILNTTNICYIFTWLSLRTLISHKHLKCIHSEILYICVLFGQTGRTFPHVEGFIAGCRTHFFHTL
jgi:hypothetical protein